MLLRMAQEHWARRKHAAPGHDLRRVKIAGVVIDVHLDRERLAALHANRDGKRWSSTTMTNPPLGNMSLRYAWIDHGWKP